MTLPPTAMLTGPRPPLAQVEQAVGDRPLAAVGWEGRGVGVPGVAPVAAAVAALAHGRGAAESSPSPPGTALPDHHADLAAVARVVARHQALAALRAEEGGAGVVPQFVGFELGE
jgi:hypothetical protein